MVQTAHPGRPTAPATPFATLDPDPLLDGSRVLRGTYRLLHRIDAGAMGTVFEAEHLRLHRRVAVKVLSPHPASRPDVLGRFRQEAEIMSQLEHPHIVTVLDFDVTERGEPYLVLELLHGETLEKRIEREAPLALEDVVTITTQVASALSLSHRASVVHRDLKPSNVFLTDAPGEAVFVKLLDFGISKNLRAGRRLTEERSLLGTPEYMSPEQATGQNDLVGPETDQYSLAVVVYEMLTGTQPFAHDDLKTVLERVSKVDPAPASSVVPYVPSELDAVLSRALAKESAKRFQDIMDFARAFAAAASLDRPSRSLLSPSAPPRAGVGGGSEASDAARCLERARAALEVGAVAEAAAHAEAALRASDCDDAAAAAVLRASEEFLLHVFTRRIGSLARRLFVNGCTEVNALPVSPRTAFLLSRIDDGMTVDELLDVASMPRVEALRWVVRLASCGAVRFGASTAPLVRR